jgi:hypothetical protein
LLANTNETESVLQNKTAKMSSFPLT